MLRLQIVLFSSTSLIFSYYVSDVIDMILNSFNIIIIS